MIRLFTIVALCVVASPLRVISAQGDSLVAVANDSVTVRFTNADLRIAIQAMARYLDRPVIFGNIGEYRVSLETPRPVPIADLPSLLRGLLRSHGLDLIDGAEFYTASTPSPPPPPAVAPVGGPMLLFVLPLRHGRAADVAATVNALYGRASAIGEIGARPSGLSDALRENLVPPEGAAAQSLQAPVLSQVAELRGDVTIVPDSRTNHLLIRASREDFELIKAAVVELDVRPLQILIEVVIAEVRRDRGLSFGVDAEVTGSNYSATSAGLGGGDLVLQVLRGGAIDVAATLSAAASRGDATILSRPVLLAANNESAEILVGSQRPFVQVQRALPTENPVRDQVVQFKDVGTKLSVRPTISADGYVMLEVFQEVNAATAEVAFDAPVISTRTIKTQLLIRDGHTAVLGGLTDQQRDVSRGGVPILSSIPILGGLFGRQVTRTSETELFIFIKPQVIRDDGAMQAATDSAGNRTRALRPPADDSSRTGGSSTRPPRTR